MKNNQLEMKLATPNCRSVRRYRRGYRARWWFSQMRAIVDSAPDHKPCEDRDLFDIRKVA